MMKRLLLFTIIFITFLPSQVKAAENVVLYTSVDDPYVRPLVRRFEQKTGISVTLVTDAEASKTAGLVERLIAEKDNPQADVYWGNEIFHTINLAEQGLLAPYRSKIADDVPARWRDKDDLYVSTGLRARMIGVSTRPANAALVAQVKRIEDLTNPALKGKIAVSIPAIGTAAGHFAALYVLWGEEKYTQFLRGLRVNDIKLLGGNAAVVEQLAAGTIAAGLTDNDDINNAKAEGMKIDGLIPDQQPGEIGTLLIPTTIALVKGAHHEANAKKLIDFLLAPEVEKELVDGRFLAYSVHNADKNVKAMEIDYPKAARAMKHAIELALTILQDRSAIPVSK